MAIDTANSVEREMLHRAWSRLAAGLSLLAGVGGFVWLLVTAVLFAVRQPQDFAASGAWAMLLLLAFPAVAAYVGWELFRGRTWAQQFLLVFYLLLAILSPLALLTEWGKVSAGNVPMALLKLGVPAVFLLGMVVLLVLAAQARSRLRYASNVMISIAAAAAVLVLANVIGAQNYVRKDLESLGQYGLSESTKHILDRVHQPVRLTSIYTSTQAERKADQYLPRVRDLLEEMHQRKSEVAVENVTSDRQKAAVLARLRKQVEETAGGHRQALAEFQKLVDAQGPKYEQMSREWQAYPATGWLAQFGTPKSQEMSLTSVREKLLKQSNKLRQELASAGLPNYPDLAQQAKTALEEARQELQGAAGDLAQLAAIPDQIEKARPALTAEATAVVADLIKAAQAVGASVPGTAPASAPASAPTASEAMDKLSVALVSAANAINRIAGELSKFAGPAQSPGPIRYARGWRNAITLYSQMMEETATRAQETRGLRQLAKPEVQARYLEQVRPLLPALLEDARTAQAALAALLNELGTITDDATRATLEKARTAGAFDEQLKAIAALTKTLDGLPELTDQNELLNQIDQDNIVLVEAGPKSGVVSFDDAWPLSERRNWDATQQEAPKRMFNGDMAISAKILGLTSEPFGEVVLTCFERIPPEQLMRQVPPVWGPIPSRYLQAMQQRLEKANLKVVTWNLAQGPQEGPPPPTKGRPQVLLVLPPPAAPGGMESPMQQQATFTKEHLARITAAVDSGIPAIFLAAWLPSGMGEFPAPFAFGDYLKQSWGLDLRTDMRMLQGTPDPVNPGSFRMPLDRWKYLPLSDFTDQAIGKPLKARRLYWLNVCPVLHAEAVPAGVTLEDVLVVPPDPPGYWATSQVMKVIDKMRMSTGGLKPDVAGGNLVPAWQTVDDHGKKASRSSLPVAAKAARAGDQKNSVVVLGVGMSFVDGFVDEPVLHLQEDTFSSEPAPLGDLDLVVNSAYDLLGQREFIGAGPTFVQPIEILAPATLTGVKVIFGLIWPVAMLAIGGIVMVFRRR